MNEKMEQLSVQIIYEQLRELLSRYEETECFNKVPCGSAMEDAAEYVAEELSNIWRSAWALFWGNWAEALKIRRLIWEVKYFARQYEVPGVTRRWKRLDPNLIYFECAFDLMEDDPEAYDEIRMGSTGLKLSCYPGEKQLAERNAYFEARRQEYAQAGIDYTDERLFQDELCRALELAFQADFPEYIAAG